MMKKSCAWMGRLAVLSLLGCASLWGKLSVEILSWQQRWPWNGLVDITYRVSCDETRPDGSPVGVKVGFSGYDRDLDRTIAMKTLTGDGASKPVKAGGTYTIVWDARKDWPKLHSSAFKIRVQAETVAEPAPDPQPATRKYLVIDLSGGPGAAKYPYRISDTGPDISQDACRTTELWLREIPAGTFMMGSPSNELGRSDNEDQHQVTLTKAFHMGVFEVTQRQWELVMGTSPSYNKGNDRPVECVSSNDIRGTENTAGASWPAHGHKVDASSFMGKLQAKTGLVFDLPTEAQWEYACRAGTTTALNSGKELTRADGKCPNLDQVGRYDSNCTDGKGGYSEHTRVGSYAPNAWGLYDMHGNVQEWCLDWYKSSLGTSPVTNPLGPEPDYGYRLFRGGQWSSSAGHCRSAVRYNIYPHFRNFSIGFRVACLNAPPPKPEPKPTTGKYLVIDLSGGPEAAKYPYRTSDTGPDISQDACRTTELWLREIPAGTFTMGSPADELGRLTDEAQHQVTLTKPFHIGVFEVTQKQWELVMGSNPSQYKGNDRPVEQVSYNDIRGTNTAELGWPAHGHKVDATSFMGKLQAKTGLVLDLPTEAQWEYACRAGTTTALNSGKELTTSTGICPNLDQVGRYGYNRTDGQGGYTVEHTRVGSYRPNDWGLYDMHGNVSEWCLDRYQKQLGTSPVTDPLGPGSGSTRLLRGGAWSYDARFCRSARRSDNLPDFRFHSYGFRVACL